MPVTGILLNSTQIMHDSLSLYEHHQWVKPKFIHPFVPPNTSLIFQHGDFCAWNILRSKNGLILIDFEEGIMFGLALYDYIYFLR